MRQTGSKPYRLRAALLAAMLIAVIATVAWTLLRSHAAANHPPDAAITSPAGASKISAERRTSPSRVAILTRRAAQVSHAIATTALPPSGTPLAQIYDELKARADAGDSRAASRLYREVSRCIRARETLRSAPLMASLIDDDTSTINAEELTRREKELARLEGELADARAKAALCDDLSTTQLQVTPIALRAAQLGDVHAANCYVGTPLMNSDGIFDHPEWIVGYRQNALALADAAVQQGDWTMVGQLQFAYSTAFPHRPLAQLTGADPLQNYRYLKLRRLGASGEDAAFFDRQLKLAAESLSADAIAAGDTWAQDTYQHHFAPVHPDNPVVHNVNICQDDDD